MVDEMMHYQKILEGGFMVRLMQADDAQQLEALQYLVFPNLADDEILHAPQYRKHVEIFPEGQYVITDNKKIIAATTTMRYHLDENDNAHHTFFEIMGGGWLTTHNPDGEWMYGLDMGVNPAYRGKGLAKELYRARQYACTTLHLKGQMMVGMLNGFAKYKTEMDIDGYFQKVKAGEIFDPTVSVQRKIGFEIRGLMKDYLNDPTCGNAGAVMVLEVSKEM